MATRRRKSAKKKTQARKTPLGSATAIAGVRVTHPDRVLYPGQDVTKRELIEYYLAVADRMLPHVAGRPLALVRCPRGSGGECFFQKHANPGWPEDFKHVRIREKSGAGQYLYIESRRGLAAAVQMGVLELHLWGATADHLEQPNRLVFDLDPDRGLPFGAVKRAARELRRRLDAFGLQSFAMATGGKGIHVVAPLGRGHGWDEHKAFAEAIAKQMAADAPERYVATMSKARRRGRIFIDYLRNTRGATAIAPYSTRAWPGAHIAYPVAWDSLAQLKNAHPASVKGIAGRIARMKDPWPGYFKLRQGLPKLRR